MKFNLNTLISKAEKVEIPETAIAKGGTSKLSFGVVNSATNGKRVTFSKALTRSLDLVDIAMIAPIPEEGVLLIAKSLPNQNAIACKLNVTEGKAVSYNASAAITLTSLFNLNFAGHTSMAFSDIDLDVLPDGTSVAIVKIVNKYPTP